VAGGIHDRSSIYLHLIASHKLSRNLRLQSDPGPKPNQQYRPKRQHNPHSSKQTTSRLKPHPPKHLHGHKREAPPQEIPTHTTRRQRRARIRLVHISRIVERGQKDREDAHRDDHQRDRRHDPVNIAITCPAEPEHADRHEQGLRTREPQASLGVRGEAGAESAHGPFVLVDEEDGAEDGADAGRGEDRAGLFEGEGVVCGVDERDGAELQVEDGPGEGDPEAEADDDGFGEEEVGGAGEGQFDHFEDGGALFFGENFVADALGVGWGVGGLQFLVVRGGWGCGCAGGCGCWFWRFHADCA